MSSRFRNVLCVAVLGVLLGTVVVTGTAAAADTGTTATTSDSVDSEVNRTFNDTAISSGTRTADGGLVLAGATGFRRANVTLWKVGPDGSTVWSRQDNSTNRSGIVAIDSGPDGGLYYIQYAYERTDGASRSYSVSLVGATETGEVEWRRSLSTRDFYAGRNGFVVSDRGPAFVGRTADRDSVSLVQFGFDGDRRFNRTYDVDATPQSLSATDDGYLLAGTVGFDHPWVLRTDETGAVQSNRTYETLDVEGLAGAVPTADGGLLLAGSYNADYTETYPWAAKVGSDGLPRWSHAYPTNTDVRIQNVVTDGDGLTLVGRSSGASSGDSVTHLVGVGPNGDQRYSDRVDGVAQTVAVRGPNRTLTLAGYRGLPGRTVTSLLRTVSLPEPTSTPRHTPSISVSSTGTYYRGQGLTIVRPQAAGDTLDLVAIPGEYDEFEPHVVRRVQLDADGRAVVDSATLDDGQYYVQTTSGTPLQLTSGWALSETDRDGARFELQSQRLRSRDRQSRYVDRAAGDSMATIPLVSERDAYEVYVTADRFRGDTVDASTLRAMFPEAVSIEQSRGVPAARLAVDSRTNLTVSTDSVDAGLYDLTIRGTDTGTAGAVTGRRLVVGTTEPRPVSVSLGSDALSVPVDGNVSTNVTVSGVTDGIGAMSMSANRSGPPAIGLSLSVEINGSTASAGAGWSSDSADADAQSFDGDTANGSVVVGTFSADADADMLDPESNATSAVQFGLDWVVDETGVPYTIPDGTTVTVTVRNIENATGESNGRYGHGSSSASGSVRVSESSRAG